MIAIRTVACRLAFSLCALLAAGCASSGDNAERSGADVAAMKEVVETRLDALALEFGAVRDLDAQDAFGMLEKHLAGNPEIYGAAFAFAPEEREGEVVKSSPYVFRAAGGLVRKDLAESYDYVSEQWYSRPVEIGRAVWSDPYFDEGGGDIWMITYSVPIYEPDSVLIGVLTSDLPTEAE